MTTPAASKKDKYGNRSYVIPHPETRELIDLPSWSRLKNQMHNGGIETFKLKQVARAVAMSGALQMEAADPETVYGAIKKALESDTEKADVGTWIHNYTEQVDAGTLDWDFVPEVGRPYIEHYVKLKADFGWEVVEAEVTIYNLLIGYAGSADRFARFPGLPARLGLPAPDLDVFPVDIKTGESIWPEVVLQLACYSGGEGIFIAPSKTDLGFTLREAQLEDDIRSGVGYDRINPKRKKWSDEAIREAKAELEAEWWKAYAQAGQFRPMPAGLRRDVGLVIHLRPDFARLVPVRLDGKAIQGVVPAAHVLDGLTALYKWSRRKDLIGEPIEAGEMPAPVESAPEPAPKPEPQKCPECGELDDFHAAGCAVVAPPERPAAEELARTYGNDPESQALDTHRAGLLEGAEVGETEDDLTATDEDKRPYIEWLGDMARNRKHLLPALRASLDKEGLTKKLRQDTWTVGELRRWSNCAIAVERAHL